MAKVLAILHLPVSLLPLAFQVAKMVALVVGVFAICWGPAHCMNLWMKLDPNFPQTKTTYFIKMTFHTLSYMNR